MRRLLAVSLLCAATSAAAQEPPSIALGGDLGPAFPQGDFAAAGAELGWTGNLSATLRLNRLLGVSAFYSRSSFGLEESEDSWVDSGYGLGGRLWVPVGGRTRVQPWAQLGVGWHDLDPLIAGPQFATLDTNGISTIEGSAGIDFPLRPHLLLLGPTVRYRKYSFEVESPTQRWTTTVSSLSIGMGLAVVLGRSAEVDR